MAEGQSLKFRFFRLGLTMLSSLMMPVAFGMALNHVPLWVKVFMFVAAAFHFGEDLVALWAREKQKEFQRSQPPSLEVFTGDDARQLNEFVHKLANKPQRSDMQ